MTVTLEEVRARGIALPTDDDAAQAVIDEQEAWLARRIGPLEGERTEEFYVGRARTRDALGLRRYTDAVELADNGVTIDADDIRLVELGSAVRRRALTAPRAWMGPYVTVTYTPNDLTEVRRVLFALCALEGPAGASGPFQSERIGDYSYTRGGTTGVDDLAGAKAILVDGIVPARNRPTTTYSLAKRLLEPYDPIINLPEVEILP